MADAQARAQAMLDDLVARGAERGVQVAAYLDGALVVDAWSGVADPATGRQVDGDTLFTVFSVTKGIAATVIHRLAERGLLDYDASVARYWPEFAAAGKGGVTLRQALSHSAGVPQMPEGVRPSDLCNWQAMCAAIAGSPPLWEPGTRTGYHALTFGWIVGEVARRVAGQPLAQIVQEELCAPLGITDLYLGIPDAAEARVAALEIDASMTDGPQPPPDSLFRRAIPATLEPLGGTMNRPDVRRACIPAAGGIMSARALARHYAALVGDGVDGVRLLTPERVGVATAVQTAEEDVVLGIAAPKALGYLLGRPQSAYGNRATAFGHGGHGGAMGFADPEYRFAFGLAKNRLRADPPGEDTATQVARTIRAALGIPEDG